MCWYSTFSQLLVYLILLINTIIWIQSTKHNLDFGCGTIGGSLREQRHARLNCTLMSFEIVGNQKKQNQVPKTIFDTSPCKLNFLKNNTARVYNLSGVTLLFV
jgi:hypothetical protein